MEARRNDTISAADGSSITGRSIDVVISRLKRRAEMLGVTLPIRSVRGRGYVFVGHLSVGRNEHSLGKGWRWGPDGCRAGSQKSFRSCCARRCSHCENASRTGSSPRERSMQK